jgi:hypothetical protein
MVAHYEDYDDLNEPFAAFSVPPGRVSGATAGTRFILFSPTAELDATEAAIRAGMETASEA